MDTDYLLLRAASMILCGGCAVFVGLLTEPRSSNGSLKQGVARVAMIYGAIAVGLGAAVLALAWGGER